MGYVEEVGEGEGKSILLYRGCKELTLSLMHRRRGSRSASAISRESCFTCHKLDWIRRLCLLVLPSLEHPTAIDIGRTHTENQYKRHLIRGSGVMLCNAKRAR